MTKRELKRLQKLSPCIPMSIAQISYTDVLAHMDQLEALSEDVLWAWWRLRFTMAKVKILELTVGIGNEYPKFKKVCVMTKQDINSAKMLGYIKEDNKCQP